MHTRAPLGGVALRLASVWPQGTLVHIAACLAVGLGEGERGGEWSRWSVMWSMLANYSRQFMSISWMIHYNLLRKYSEPEATPTYPTIMTNCPYMHTWDKARHTSGQSCPWPISWTYPWWELPMAAPGVAQVADVLVAALGVLALVRAQQRVLGLVHICIGLLVLAGTYKITPFGNI